MQTFNETQGICATSWSEALAKASLTQIRLESEALPCLFRYLTKGPIRLKGTCDCSSLPLHTFHNLCTGESFHGSNRILFSSAPVLVDSFLVLEVIW